MSRGLRAYVAAISLFVAGLAFAQAPGTGAIVGAVYDPAGSVISGAQVFVKNDATGRSRSVGTTSEGIFRAQLLAPGTYSVSVIAAGFAPGEAAKVQVTVSETSSLEFKMSIARIGTTVEAQSVPELAQTQSATLGRAVDSKAILALPLSNRNYTQILGLSPGVAVGLPDATELGRGTQNVVVNGNKPTANNIQFNGVDANNLSQNSAANDGEEVGTAIPAPDAIQEFKVQTANYDAGYGRGTGANVDLISKGGTNGLHGSAWEFFGNDALNANDFFSKLTGQPRPVLKQNLFGGSIGGPIKRDKSFFFVAYQGLISSNGEGGKVTTTLPLLTSDRSATTLGSQFCPANHANGSGYLTHAGGTQVACDGSNISPVALAVLNFKLPSGQFAVPNPQIALPNPDPTQISIGESTFASPASYKENQVSVNIDQVLSASNQIAGRFFYLRAPTTEPFSPNAADLPGWPTNELDGNTMFVLADTHVFSPTLVNIARFGFMRYSGNSAVFNPILASDIGTGSPTGPGSAGAPAPGITIDGMFTIGDAGTPSQWQNTNTFVWQDTASLTHGRHNFRFGAEVKRDQVDVNAPFTTNGLLDIRTLNDFLLGQSAAQNGSPNGISNVTQSTGASGLFRKDERYTDFAGFFQDDLKVSPRLTLNLGVRYEIFGAPSEIHGRLPNFDPSIALHNIPASGSFSGFIVPSNFEGAVPQGVVKSGQSTLWSTNLHDVSPRFGFALQLTQTPVVVLRGGYGVYYDRLSGDLAESTLGQPPFSLFQLLADSSNGGASLQAPFSPVLPPATNFPIFIPRLPSAGLSLSGNSPNLTDPYTQEYNLNMQFGITNNLLLEIGYVGTHGNHVVGTLQFNQALLASPTNPVNGATSNTVANVIQRLPFQGVSPGSLNSQTSFLSNYNALQSSLTQRFSHGLQFLASYTWSKYLDETSGSSGGDVFELWLLTNDQNNTRQAYGLSDFNRAQRAVLSFVYDVPKAQSLPSFWRHVASDWQFSGILVSQSGTPLTILDSNAGAVYGNFSFENRAQRTNLNPATSGSVFSRVTGQFLNPNAFTSAPEAPFGGSAADTDFGNSGVGIVRGPGQRNIDLSVERIFPVTEGASFRFRAEAFNLTNTPNFGNPNNNVASGATFGVITTTVANPRIIKLAVKYLF